MNVTLKSTGILKKYISSLDIDGCKKLTSESEMALLPKYLKYHLTIASSIESVEMWHGISLSGSKVIDNISYVKHLTFLKYGSSI